MTRSLTVAALQMNSGALVDENLATASKLIRRAASQGANLVVLPENFAAMSGDQNLRLQIAETDRSGPIQDAMSQLAKDTRLWLVAGTIPLLAGDDVPPVAACLVYGPDGRRVARYDKIHLFDVSLPDAGERYLESSNTAAGQTPVLAQTPWGGLGLSVCYDLRFPELYRDLVADGAEILVVPAAFTVATGRAHWETLLRARAIENLAFVVAAGQTGEHPYGRRSWGHSMVLGPWGELLASADTAEDLILAQLDLDGLTRLRNKFPVLTHRRLGVGRQHSPVDPQDRLN